MGVDLTTTPRPPVYVDDPTLQVLVDYVMAHGAHYSLLGVPAIASSVIFLARVVYLRRNKIEHSYGRTNVIYWTSQLALAAAALSFLVLSFTLLTGPYSIITDGLLSSAGWLFVSALTAIYLNSHEHRYTIRASDILTIFYIVIFTASSLSLYILLGNEEKKTIHFVDPPPASAYRSGPFRSLLFANIALAIAFFVEIFPRTNTKVQRASREREELNAYDQANLFSRLTFHYATHTVVLGGTRPLQNRDVDSKVPSDIKTSNNHELLAIGWLRRIARRDFSFFRFRSYYDDDNVRRGPPSLLVTVLWAYRIKLLFAILARTASVVFIYVPIFLLKYLIRFFVDYADAIKNDTTPPAASLGYAIAISMFVSTLFSGILLANSARLLSTLGISARAGLTAMIYRKALRLSRDARAGKTVGDLIDYMARDAELWLVTSDSLHAVVTIPVELGIAAYLLYDIVGWSVLAGVGVYATVAVILALFGSIRRVAERLKYKALDSRIALLREVLSNIKPIKFNGWEGAFRRKIDATRSKELNAQRGHSVIRAFMETFFSSANLLITLGTFAVYATIGGPDRTPGPITAEIIFVGIALFARLGLTLSLINYSKTHLIAVKEATIRLRNFFLAEEVETNNVAFYARQVPTPQNSPGGFYPGIDVNDCTFAWTRKRITVNNPNLPEYVSTLVEQGCPYNRIFTAPRLYSAKENDPSVLRDINLYLTDGKMAAVIGGSGKSTLLHGIAGQLYKFHGFISIFGTIAFVPEEDWILNNTIRENIVFGATFDQERYDQALFVTGLVADINALPAKDHTEVGERGDLQLTISQRKRVALARAVYQDPTIYLFDDPLRFVEPELAKHLWDNLLGPNGIIKTKTRMIATRDLSHIKEFDQILLIAKGRIVEDGTYDFLYKAKNYFYRLINNFETAQQSAQKKADKTPIRVLQNKAAVVQIESAQESKKAAQPIVSESLAADRVGSVKVAWKTYWEYIKAISIVNVILFVVLFVVVQAVQIATNVGLARWVADLERGNAQPTIHYLTKYGVVAGIFIAVDLIAYLIVNVICGVRGARILHERLITRVLRMPFSFFDVTPLGRVIDRFSYDTHIVDNHLPLLLPGLLRYSTSILAIFVVIYYSIPSFVFAIPPLVIIFLLAQFFYFKTACSFKRLSSVAKAPLYDNFEEALTGAHILRSDKTFATVFEHKNLALSDVVANTTNYQMLATHWLTVRLQIISAVAVLAVAYFGVEDVEHISTSRVGLSLVYVLGLSTVFTLFVRSFNDLQILLISVERIHEYSRKPNEAPLETEPMSAVKIPQGWIREGRIEFKNYSTRYREGQNYAIKEASFAIEAREKVGIVGPSGAGKTALVLSLFRLLEAADSFWSIASDPEMGQHHMDPEFMLCRDGGSIEIDGQDISRVGLKALRKQLTIIPQETTLFVGTLRENLDPLREFSDSELWDALRRAHLKDYVASLHGELSYKVTRNSANFSPSQKALIGLARALLTKTKVLIVDEPATTLVDSQTHALIQQTIRHEFVDRTVLTIARHAHTVLESDRVLVVDNAAVREFDVPGKLLQQRDSLFYHLAQQEGEIIA
ncbi:Canalicular multispecific organic anion transporter 2 [Podila epigama]|nr:Canalicular multispecific organic anion transporter 2 [Podila epigama]